MRTRRSPCIERPRLSPLAPAIVLALCAVARAGVDEDAASRAQAAAEIAASVSTSVACAIEVRGTPRFDELANAWLVAYTATGSDCDAAAAQLRQRGQAGAIVFFRRPDAGQVRALIGSMRHSVEPAFGCPISVRGEPRFDEASGYWLVSYVASGAGCDDAAQELERLGAELQIRFMRTLLRVELLR
jgi:hypothetical protein